MKKYLLSFLFFTISTIAFSQIIITSTVTNVSCFGGSNGSATITASGGTGACTYTWLPSNSSATTLIGVAAGNYTVIVEDAVANTNSLVITIGQPTQIILLPVTQNSLTCAGWCNGTASVSVMGGTAPYTYTWSNGSTLTWVQNLCPGVYFASVTDMQGCSTTQSLVIASPPPINITSTVTNASCQNSCNGSINATVTGGTPGYTYTWTTSGPPFGGGGGTPSIYAACAGVYTLVVADALGCVQALAINVGISYNNTLPNAIVTNTSYNETCHLTGDGAIDVTITGSNPGPFIYQWSNGANTQDITNVVSNIYFLSITDGSANCITIKDTISSIGTNCGTINGNVYVDNNSDCVKNSGDNDYQNAIVLINPGNRIGYTNMNGSYAINSLPYGTYSVTLITSTNTPVFPTCTTTLNATVNSGNQNPKTPKPQNPSMHM